MKYSKNHAAVETYVYINVHVERGSERDVTTKYQFRAPCSSTEQLWGCARFDSMHHLLHESRLETCGSYIFNIQIYFKLDNVLV